jgi:Protein of unknown function (DUF3631)/Toprim-like
VRSFYIALGVDLPTAATTDVSVSCFANPDAHKHGDSHPSCSVSPDTGLWHCHSCGASGNAFQAARSLGRSKAEAMALLEEHGLLNVTGEGKQVSPPIGVSESELAEYRDALESNAGVLERLAAERGWTTGALRQLEVGYDGERLTLPGRSSGGDIVGLSRYLPWRDRGQAPKLISVPGSKRELFPPPETIEEDGGYLVLVEGEPDAISAASLGVAAVGLPGAKSWQREWRERFRGRRVCIVFDADEPGRAAASKVAKDLLGVTSELRVWDLAQGREDGFDLSDWIAEKRGEGLMPDQVAGLLELRASRAALVEPENGAAVLSEIVGFLRRYVVLGSAELEAIALWVVHTHAFAAAEATPYLSITSAEKASGKTRLLEALELLVARPWLTGRVTPAVLTRKIDAEEPTLLLDESDAAFGGEKEYAEVLRGILNTGYRRGGKTSVAVPAGRSFECLDLSTFSPKAIAGIGKLPDTVTSRSIPIGLKRRTALETVERFRRRRVEKEAAPLRGRIEALAGDIAEELIDAEPELPEELGDRAADVWEPLLAIAHAAGGEWVERAERAALSLSARDVSEDDSLGVKLLGDVRTVLSSTYEQRISTETLIEKLALIEESPWRDWYGKHVTPRKVAQILKPYGIKPKTFRFEERIANGYERAAFVEAWDRYLPWAADEVMPSDDHFLEELPALEETPF